MNSINKILLVISTISVMLFITSCIGQTKVPVDTTKTIIIDLHFEKDSILIDNVSIVYSLSRENTLRWGDFKIRIFSNDESLIKEYGIWDPRIILVEDGSRFIPNVSFTLVYPFFQNIKKINMYKGGTDELILSIDLSDEIHDFCKSINFRDKACQKLGGLLEVGQKCYLSDGSDCRNGWCYPWNSANGFGTLTCISVEFIEEHDCVNGQVVSCSPCLCNEKTGKCACSGVGV